MFERRYRRLRRRYVDPMTKHRKCRFEIRRARSQGQAAKLGIPADLRYPLD
jgi:hypothetical protein